MSREALDYYHQIRYQGQEVFRLGQEGFNRVIGEGRIPKYWSANKADLRLSYSEYSAKYGSVTNKYNFVEVARYTGKGDFVVRKAPAANMEAVNNMRGVKELNPGGGLEIVLTDPAALQSQFLQKGIIPYGQEAGLHPLLQNRLEDLIK